jgi:catechol 2,3-dioxygenase-like lactoylglutathione lyase family enzyme
MTTGTIGHMQINVNMKNAAFYKEFLALFGWKTLCDAEIAPGKYLLGIEDANKTSLWFCDPIKQVDNDYDGIGLNHIGISVPSQAAVDEAVAFLKKHNIPALFETPRHRPEFCDGPENTYYQVMFESPDRILFEVVYQGPKQG